MFSHADVTGSFSVAQADVGESLSRISFPAAD